MKKEIKITEINGIRIGQAENTEAGTGCTVLISENGMAAGLDVRGGGPASRESELMNPLAAASAVHGVVLAGGSAFGLGAADGVMKYLEERGIGFDVGVTKVPLVCQADLFDLTVGDPSVRPDKEMGYQACMNSEKGNYRTETMEQDAELLWGSLRDGFLYEVRNWKLCPSDRRTSDRRSCGGKCPGRYL